MRMPSIADNKPIKVDLTQGLEYHFCTCGGSKSQPFCDGSHAGTQFKPKAFVAEETGETYLCQCKYTGNAPYCDGTHKQFGSDQIGKEGPVEAMPEFLPGIDRINASDGTRMWA